MPDIPGDTFVSKGIEYVLQYGPKGNLRPYVVGPVAALARKGASLLPKFGWAGLAIGAVFLIGAGVLYIYNDRNVGRNAV